MTEIKEISFEKINKIIKLYYIDLQKFIIELERMNKTHEFIYTENLLNPSFILINYNNNKTLYFANINDKLIQDEYNKLYEIQNFNKKGQMFNTFLGISIGYKEKEKIIWNPTYMIQNIN